MVMFSIIGLCMILLLLLYKPKLLKILIICFFFKNHLKLYVNCIIYISKLGRNVLYIIVIILNRTCAYIRNYV